MSNTQRYAGLRALVSKLSMGSSRTALSASQAGSAEDDRDEDENGEGEDPKPAQQPAPTGEGGEGDDGNGEDGDNGNDEDDDAAGDEGGAADGDDAGEGEGGGETSAEYQRGFAAGNSATAGRWAATFLNESCRANLELATDLLADTDMSPDKIAAYCSRNPGAKAGGLQRLANTPKPKIGLETGSGKGDGTVGDVDQAAQSRAAANARVNAKTKRRAGRGGVTRKAGGPGGSIKDAAAAGGEQ